MEGCLEYLCAQMTGGEQNPMIRERVLKGSQSFLDHLTLKIGTERLFISPGPRHFRSGSSTGGGAETDGRRKRNCGTMN